MKKILLLLCAGGILTSVNGQTARIQAIHNSADAAAAIVDVYLTTPLGSSLLIDDFAFRTASSYINAPAGVNITIGVAPSSSTSVNDTIPGASFTYNLTMNNTYVLVAEGIVSASGYSPAIPFGISVYAMGREAATLTGNTDVLVHHGSTDAPTVDVDEISAGNLVDNASYGDFAGYLQLPTADYQLLVKDSSGTTTVASYDAPLATLNLDDSALVVVASGFLNPSNNSNGAAFGLFVALPGGGALIALPASTTGLDDKLTESLELNVYPNPTNNFLKIDGVDLNSGNVSIIDITGRQVKNETFSVSGNSINVSGITQGSYQLILTNESQIIGRAKFVKH